MAVLENRPDAIWDKLLKIYEPESIATKNSTKQQIFLIENEV